MSLVPAVSFYSHVECFLALQELTFDAMLGGIGVPVDRDVVALDMVLDDVSVVDQDRRAVGHLAINQD